MQVIKQLSVFLQNEQGRLEELTSILADAGINISALSVAENSEYGIMRMLVSDVARGAEILKERDFSVKVTSVLCIETPDQPGALQKALRILSGSGINVSYMYGYSNGGTARLVLKVSDPDSALQLLSE